MKIEDKKDKQKILGDKKTNKQLSSPTVDHVADKKRELLQGSPNVFFLFWATASSSSELTRGETAPASILSPNMDR